MSRVFLDDGARSLLGMVQQRGQGREGINNADGRTNEKRCWVRGGGREPTREPFQTSHSLPHLPVPARPHPVPARAHVPAGSEHHWERLVLGLGWRTTPLSIATLHSTHPVAGKRGRSCNCSRLQTQAAQPLVLHTCWRLIKADGMKGRQAQHQGSCSAS